MPGFLDSPVVQNAIIIAGLSVLGFLLRLAKNLVIEKLDTFEAKILAHVEATTARREEQLKTLTDTQKELCDKLTEVKDDLGEKFSVTVGELNNIHKAQKEANGQLKRVRRDVDWLLGDKGRPLDMEISD